MQRKKAILQMEDVVRVVRVNRNVEFINSATIIRA